MKTISKVELTNEEKYLAASIINNFGSGEHLIASDENIGLFVVEYVLETIDSFKFQETLLGKDLVIQNEVAVLKNKLLGKEMNTHSKATAAVDMLGEFVDAIAEGNHSDILINEINELREKHKYLLINI